MKLQEVHLEKIIPLLFICKICKTILLPIILKVAAVDSASTNLANFTSNLKLLWNL